MIDCLIILWEAVFFRGLVSIDKYAMIYNGKFLDFDGDETITFQDCAGEDFSYQELMIA
ncbi:MAG: hypothetical protein ACUZ8H_05380 [Candidatus Anammoxibacter sp.]